MPRMRGRLYSSCASSTWSLPSAVTACWAKMSRISCVRSTTRASSDVLEATLLRRARARRRRRAPPPPRPRTPTSAPRACPCRRTCAGPAGRGAGRARRPVRGRRSARARGARRAPLLRGRAAGTRRRSRALRAAPGAGSGCRWVTRTIMQRCPTARGETASVGACASRPSSRSRRRIRSSRSSRQSGRRRHAGIEIIDFGQGDPREPTDPPNPAKHWRRASPRRWRTRRRRGCPSSARRSPAGAVGGSASLSIRIASSSPPTAARRRSSASPRSCSIADSAKDTVLVPDPAYPVYERGAEFAGASVERASAARGERLPPGSRARSPMTRSPARRFVWIDYPNNPTAAVAPPAFFDEVARLAEEHDFLVCSDEAYSELWFDEPPASALGAADRSPRRRLQHAQQALVDDRLPVGVRRRRRHGSSTRCKKYRPDGGHGAAGVRPARIDRRVGRRGARGASARQRTGANATSCSPCSTGTAGVSPGRPRRCTSGSAVPAGESSEHAADAPARARHRRRSRLVPRRGTARAT